jgi:hypothetical protein
MIDEQVPVTPGSPGNLPPAFAQAKAQLCLDLTPNPASIANAIAQFAGPA